jgi:hypothetical protein
MALRLSRGAARATCTVASIASFLWACGLSGDGTSPTSPLSEPMPGSGGGGVHPAPAVTHLPSGTSAPPRSDHDASLPVQAASGQVAPPFVIAPRPPAPQLVSMGGPVMKRPVIVAVTWDVDPDRVATEKFAADFGKTAYWKTLAAPYGVGELTSGPPVHISAPPPATITDDEIALFVAAQIDRADAAWPSSTTEEFLYTLFYPASTRITAAADFSVACESFYGWHSEATLKSGRIVPFAVMPKCTVDDVIPFHGMDVIAATAAHEWFEATTDPFPLSNPAYAAMDRDHVAWGDNYGAEIGDLCQSGPESTMRVPGLDLAVQRVWSNEAAMAGHDPCQPSYPGDGPYFAAVPVIPETASAKDGGTDEAGSRQGEAGAESSDGGTETDGAPNTTPGLHLTLGESKSVDVVLYSDAPTEPWTVSAVDGTELNAGTPKLAFTFDRASGRNGDVLHMTVTRNAGDAGSSTLYLVNSVLGKAKTQWVGYVVND